MRSYFRAAQRRKSPRSPVPAQAILFNRGFLDTLGGVSA